MKVYYQPVIDWRSFADDIKRRLSVPKVLQHFGWHISRDRKRAHCGLCGHKDSVAVKQDVWYCHHCHRGGSIFDLIMAARDVRFPDALKYAANLARVELPDQITREERGRLHREAAEYERKRRQRDALCRDFEERERTLRIECCRQIHECDRVLATPAPWSDEMWHRARAACVLRDEFLLPRYTLLAYAPVAERIRYLLASQPEQIEILRSVRLAGGVVGADGGRVELTYE
jgi:hypothetical protein